jgi:bloom syndrome protein
MMQFRADCEHEASYDERRCAKLSDLRLGELRKDYPGVPIMALTATAQNKVQEDIIRSLGITGCSVLRQSFNRTNLHYEVRPKKKNVISDMVAFINAQKMDGKDVCGIIYCSSRDRCENLAKELRDKHGKEAHHYHAGMSKGDRRKVQEGWQEHKFEIIVATVSPRRCRSMCAEG